MTIALNTILPMCARCLNFGFAFGRVSTAVVGLLFASCFIFLAKPAESKDLAHLVDQNAERDIRFALDEYYEDTGIRVENLTVKGCVLNIVLVSRYGCVSKYATKRMLEKISLFDFSILEYTKKEFMSKNPKPQRLSLKLTRSAAVNSRLRFSELDRYLAGARSKNTSGPRAASEATNTFIEQHGLENQPSYRLREGCDGNTTLSLLETGFDIWRVSGSSEELRVRLIDSLSRCTAQ